MFRKFLTCGVLLAVLILTGCGASTPGPNGSRHQTMNGASGDGYPAGQPKDAESPALASSSEQQHSNPSPKVAK